MSLKRFAACSLVASAAAGACSKKPVQAASAPASASANALANGPALSAAELIEKNAVAHGGVDAWRKIETMAWVGRIESARRGGRVPFLIEMKRPNRTRFEVTVDNQKSVRVFDGTQGWKMRAGPGGQPDVQPFTVDELRFAHGAPVIEGPLMDFAARGATITLAGLHEIDGRKAYALSLALGPVSAYKVWIDAETFLELRYDREFIDAQGKTAVSSVYFTNYRAIEGLTLPLTIETGTPDGKTRDKLVIERVALNPKLDDRTFARPGSAVSRRRGMVVDMRSAAQGYPASPAR